MVFSPGPTKEIPPMTSVPPHPRSNSFWLAAGLLATITVCAYLPVFNGGFIWDDDVYVFTNPLVTSEDGLHDIWLTAKSIEYYPLFYSTLWAEWKLWGMNAAGYHTVNILLHVLNVLLVWRVLKSLEVAGALLAALLFAVHPVNVESVAWISELKNTLSLLFFLLTCLAWLRFRQKPQAWGFYALALGLFLLALLSKTTVVVFPVLMLGVAWWRGGRITSRDLRLALPFFILALAMGLLLIWFLPHRFPSDEVIRQAGILPRLSGAGLASWFYLGKVVFPYGLCLVYPHWNLDTGHFLTLLPLILLLGVFGFFWVKRAGWGRVVLLGVGFFWMALLPSLGLIVHPYLKQSPVADRWLYLPLIGLTALVGAAWSRWRKAGKTGGGNFAVGVATVVVIVLAVLTYNRSALFADAETLYRETLSLNPAAVGVRNNLALVLINKGQRAEAIRELKRVTADDPGSSEAWNNLGNLVLGAGRPREAIPYLEKALELRPDMLQGKLNLGLALAEVGRINEAAPLLQAAAAGSGDNALINQRLGDILAKAGRHREAAAALRKVLAREPDNLQAAYHLAGTLVAGGDRPGAIRVYQDIVRRHPREVGAQVNLGNLYAGEGRASEAVTAYRAVLRLNPTLSGALNNLAWLLATHPDPSIRNGPEALRLAEQAVETAGGESPRVFETLAAARAAVGQFDAAAASQRRALELVGATADERQRASMEQRLALYEKGQPCVE
jgi:tetratricopeptide (TPR) repeat protein